MRSRRNFVRLALLALIAPAAGQARPRAAESPRQVFLPLILGAPGQDPQAPPDDMPLLGPPSGTAAQAVEWLSARCAAEYTRYDVGSIVETYQRLGEWAGVDWFLAIAQMAHETGSLTSWWSGRPRRNPAGIAVTGVMQTGASDAPPGSGWTWDDRSGFWREGWSFPSWADHAIPAHLGRLLAYALTDAAASPAQLDLISYALSYRAMPERYRGIAPTIAGLNGRWAVPGTTYGQRIIELAWSIGHG